MSYLKSILVFIALSLLSVSAMAVWPTKTITIIIPNPPGAFNDYQVRVIQDYLEKTKGVDIIVKFLPGAGGVVATNEMLRSTNDNHTFMFSDSLFVVGPAVLGKDTAKQFTPVIVTGKSHYVMFTKDPNGVSVFRNQVKNKTLVNVGYTNSLDLWVSKLNSSSQFNLIPYKGGAEVLASAMAGQTDYGITALAGAYTKLSKDPEAKNALYPTMLFDKKRSEQFPDVPTANELGFSGVQPENWYTVVAVNGTSTEALETFNSLIRLALKNDTRYKELTTRGWTLLNLDQAQSKKYVDDQIKIWDKIAKKD